MIKSLLILSFLFIMCGSNSILLSQSYVDRIPGLKTTNYVLDISIDYDQKKIFGKCWITFKNVSDHNIGEVPLLLYRLLKVKSVTSNSDSVHSFTSQIVTFEDWDSYQVNFISVNLRNDILPDNEETIKIEYEGFLKGFAETGNIYVKDNIDKKFTILRPDCLAFPEIGFPSWKSNRSAGFDSFSYSINITVPQNYVVANGGMLVNKLYHNDKVTYSYKNIKPSWRIDIAIAEYSILEGNNIKIYYFPEDSVGAKMVLNAMNNAMRLYEKWWGPLAYFDKFSVIEIPDGFGSQTDVTTIIQTAAAFRDKKQLRQFYHELTHLWNVKPNDQFPPRWEEGLATFLEFLTAEKLDSILILDEMSKLCYDIIIKNLEINPDYKKVPLIKFGEKGMHKLSYSVGMLVFQILYELIGEENFNEIIDSFYRMYNESGATTEEFLIHLKNKSKIDLTDFINDWITGTKYCDYILQGFPIENIVTMYKMD